MVTDTIDRFTEQGVLTQSGELLEADIIVTATGFDLSILGDIEFAKDGQPIHVLRWSSSCSDDAASQKIGRGYPCL